MEKTEQKKEGRDQILGRALAEAIRQEGAKSSCPSPEEMAALQEQRLSDSERQQIMGHIAACDRCLSWFILSSAQRKKSKFKYFSGAAVAAALILSVFWPLRGYFFPKLQGPSQAQVIAVSLAQLLWQQEAPMQVVTSTSGQTYGFASVLSPDKTAFRTGVRAMDLVAACKFGDVTARSAAINHLNRLLGSEASDIGMKSMVGSTTPSQDVLNQVLSGIAKHEKDKGQLEMFQFGAWVQAARLSNDELLPKVVHLTALDELTSFLDGKELAEPVAGILAKLHSIIASEKPLKSEEIRRIRHLLDDLTELF